jgi:hypothetical protein
MGQLIIGIGSTPDDGTGDTARDGGIKINSNFDELYTHIADDTIHFLEEDIDHTNIQSIGDNSHAAIDTHIIAGDAHIGLTNWNAHGNTATGDATNPLIIEESSFIIEGTTGDVPPFIDGTAGTYFAWIPSKLAFRAQSVDGNQDAIIGARGAAIGRDNTCPATQNFAIGDDNLLSANNQYVVGVDNTLEGRHGYVFGRANDLSARTANENRFKYVFGDNNIVDAADTLVAGIDNNVTAIGTTGDHTVAGKGNVVGGSSNTVFGGFNTAPGTSSLIAGLQNTISSNGVALGVNAEGLDGGNLLVGLNIKATEKSGMVIGSGVDAGEELINPDKDTLWMGIFSETPIVILRQFTMGIIEQNPLSTLDVGGSVGYKYTNLRTADEPKTIGPDDAELNFIVDIEDFDTGNDGDDPKGYKIYLPKILSTAVDRRMYHFSPIHGTTGDSATNHELVLIPAAGDFIWQESDSPVVGDGVNDSINAVFGPGDSIQITACFEGNLDTMQIITAATISVDILTETASTISFTAPDTIDDSGSGLPVFRVGEEIVITGSSPKHVSSTISWSAPSTINDSASELPIYANAETITISDADKVNNNGAFVVDGPSSTNEIVVNETTLEDDAEGEEVTIVRSNDNNGLWIVATSSPSQLVVVSPTIVDEDEGESITIASNEHLSAIRDSGSGLPIFSATEEVTVSGAAETENNGVFTVYVSNPDVLVVTEDTLIDETAGASITIANNIGSPIWRVI